MELITQKSVIFESDGATFIFEPPTDRDLLSLVESLTDKTEVSKVALLEKRLDTAKGRLKSWSGVTLAGEPITEKGRLWEALPFSTKLKLAAFYAEAVSGKLLEVGETTTSP
jgi:hypothetical protein